MTKVSNDLLIACDRKTPTLLMFLDLSAAFDTVDQDKLLQILDKELGIRGIALKWFESFLKGRTQRVMIGNSYSSEETLDFGVAQGSILGPPFFNAYTRTFPDKVKVTVLTLEAQVNKVVSSCFSTIRLLSRVKFFLESE